MWSRQKFELPLPTHKDMQVISILSSLLRSLINVSIKFLTDY